MHYKDNKTQKLDGWHMDLGRLAELVGRQPSAVEVHNRHVVCTFPGLVSTNPETKHSIQGGDTIIRFRQW